MEERVVDGWRVVVDGASGFRVRDRLKRMGFRWNRYAKTWYQSFRKRELAREKQIAVRQLGVVGVLEQAVLPAGGLLGTPSMNGKHGLSIPLAYLGAAADIDRPYNGRDRPVSIDSMAVLKMSAPPSQSGFSATGSRCLSQARRAAQR